MTASYSDNSNSSSGGNSKGFNTNPMNNHYTASMQWSECINNNNSNNTSAGDAAAPTIKNHSVTNFGRYLYCFGGYDGRRNHMTLLLYDLQLCRWIVPTRDSGSISGISGSMSGNPADSINHGSSHNIDDFMISNFTRSISSNNSIIINNSSNATIGGDPAQGMLVVQGTPPPGRNGHSSTLAADDDENGCIVIIGGWLGTGPLAASDMHVLDVSGGGRLLRWYQPTVQGTPPGPCNMHSADYIVQRKEVYVFRGGNGREYLNDLHALDVKTFTWRTVVTTGAIPEQRANHSSAVLDETAELFIFGGWNGTERLNDIHILDTVTSTWTFPRIGGVLPHPRAGMTLTGLRGRLYLFGGSGTSAKCFQDLQILDRQEMAWLDVSQCDDSNSSSRHFAQVQQHISNNNNLQYDPQFHVGGNQLYDESINRSARRLPSVVSQDDHNTRFGGSFPDGADAASLMARPQQGGTQEGGSSSPNMNGSSLFALSDDYWRSRDMTSVRSSRAAPIMYPHHANPNDEDTVPSVLVHGHGPGRRAGHTATAVNRRIYIFGGSCGSDYLNDFFVLDTDPYPQAVVTEPTSMQLFERRLRHFFNDEEFADVTFLVQGRKVYGHKMILSIVSDWFRAMFTTGFRESDEMEIEIPDCSHAAFLAVMKYIYTGALPTLDMAANYHYGDNNNRDRNLARVVEMLELADRFFLDHLKQICESVLQPVVNAETVDCLFSVAQKTNASQLQATCKHFFRNRETGVLVAAPPAMR